MVWIYSDADYIIVLELSQPSDHMDKSSTSVLFLELSLSRQDRQHMTMDRDRQRDRHTDINT